MNNALNEFIFQSKYSRYNPSLGRKETWEESVDRISNMHIQHLTENYPQALNNAEFASDYLEAIEAYKEKKVFGSQRGLQFGGTPILRKHCRLFNCSATYADRLEVFKQAEWVMLCGCGVGISVEKQHVDKLPSMNNVLRSDTEDWIIPDTIEGWALAIQQIINYYFVAGTKYPKFDYSQIRPKGALITGGFVAPGPKGLRKTIQKIDELLKQVHKTTKKLSPLNVADILCFEADSVLSGGLRRSAMIILFDPDDQEMTQAKTGNWFIENPQRGRFNASAVLQRGETNKDVFMSLFNSTRQFGEPGFLWRSNKGLVVNPCCEIGMHPVDPTTGQTGWQFCNLISISGKDVHTEEEFYNICKHAATIGTIQASYMSFPFLGEATENIIKNDPLIGVSIAGVMCSPNILLNGNVLEKGAEIVKQQNAKIAEVLNIKPSSRCTCIKPDGNTSAMSGNTPGCHGDHARHYIRRVQVNKDEEAGQIYQKANPKAVLESVWSNNRTDNCIMFAISAEPNALTKKDLLGIKQLAVVKELQNHWVRAGKVNPNDTIENNVSNTVNVPEDQWEEVSEYVWENQNDLAGVSFIAETGDLDYVQPAYSEVLMPQELLDRYGEGVIFASGLIVDSIDIFGDLWNACETFRGRGESIFTSLKDAEEFIEEFTIAKIEDYLDKPLKEWNEVKAKQYSRWIDLLVQIGYSEEFAEQLVDNDVPIPTTEIQKYLDKQLFGRVPNLAAKRDLIRRMKKYSDKYYEGNDTLMINALKHVQLYHDWCDITKSYKPIDWKEVKWKNVLIEADTTGAVACNGGACEVTRI
jgi:ribonucleoside-diphosphate reductase alpha chain